VPVGAQAMPTLCELVGFGLGKSGTAVPVGARVVPRFWQL